MNMTTEEPTMEPEVQETTEQVASPTHTNGKQQIFRMMQRISKMQQNPEKMRIIANHQRVQNEYNQLIGMNPDQRGAILFHGQCILTSREARSTKQGAYYHAEYHQSRL